MDNIRLKWLKPCRLLPPILYRISWLGFDQLCWHNFGIIGTNFGGIRINASIIGSDLPISRCGYGVWFDLVKIMSASKSSEGSSEPYFWSMPAW